MENLVVLLIFLQSLLVFAYDLEYGNIDKHFKFGVDWKKVWKYLKSQHHWSTMGLFFISFALMTIVGTFSLVLAILLSVLALSYKIYIIYDKNKHKLSIGEDIYLTVMFLFGSLIGIFIILI